MIKSEALNHIAEYVTHNDLSERAFQLERSGLYFKGNSCDAFAPLGPFISTEDKRPNNLNFWLKLKSKTFK